MNNAQNIALRIVFFAAAAVTGLKLGIFLMGPATPPADREEDALLSARVEPSAQRAPKTVAQLAPPSATLPPMAPWQEVEKEADAAPAAAPDPRTERKPAATPARVSLREPQDFLFAAPEATAPLAVEPPAPIPPEASEEDEVAGDAEVPPNNDTQAATGPGPATLFVQACAFRDRGDLVAAAEAFERVHELDATREIARRSAAHTWCRVGATRLSDGDVAGAREALARSVELEPCCPSTLHNAGVAHARAEDWAQAEDAFRRAVEQDDQVPRRYLVLGLVLVQRQDLEGAERVARRLRRYDRSLARRLERAIRAAR